MELLTCRMGLLPLNNIIRLHNSAVCKSFMLSRRHLACGKLWKPSVNWKSKEVRQSFLEYFLKNDHIYVHSSSVIPRKGDGTYFVSAGMNQFKPLFLGQVDPDSEMSKWQRVTNHQKCIRVGGKHSDLDIVGSDTYHHTFFEMLGSWSFADYFKQDACKFAWTLLTEVYGIPANRLYVTYFNGDNKLGLSPDLECRDIWLEIGLPETHILPFDSEDNFWDMGDTGPCGPCSEIHFDYLGDPDAAKKVNSGSPFVVELWNLVFMQFDRLPGGGIKPLPKLHVDTGMGLERLTAVLQGTTSNYDTDLFAPLINHTFKHSNCRQYSGLVGDADEAGIDTAYRIVADHIRMITVAIGDGLLPGVGEDAKLRNIMYRCFNAAHSILGAPVGLVPSLVHKVIDILGGAYPEIQKNAHSILEVVTETEKRYLQGKSVRTSWQKHKQKAVTHAEPVNGESVNTGSSVDVIDALVLDQHALNWLEEQGIPKTFDLPKYDVGDTYNVSPVTSKLLGIWSTDGWQTSVPTSLRCGLLLNTTCFYAEKGGQSADKGSITCSETGAEFIVEDVQFYGGYVLHIGCVVKGSFEVQQDHLSCNVDETLRKGCTLNHTATHLLQNALSKSFGQVHQRASSVTPNKLVFSFSSSQLNLDRTEMENVEKEVKTLISHHIPVYRELVNLKEACNIPNLCTLEHEIYPNSVYVVSIGRSVSDLLGSDDDSHNCSVELCAGTHVHNTADIQDFVITNIQGLAQGTKTITAITGTHAKQAWENFTAIHTKFDQLKQDVLGGKSKETWLDRVRGLQAELTGSSLMLPSLAKDKLEHSLAHLLREHISRIKNVKQKDHLSRKIAEVVSGRDKPVVAVHGFTSAKDVGEVLFNLKPNVPVIFLSPTQTSFVFGVCYIPQDWSGTNIESWDRSACEQLPSATSSVVPGKKFKPMQQCVRKFTVTLPDGWDLDKLKSVCEASL